MQPQRHPCPLPAACGGEGLDRRGAPAGQVVVQRLLEVFGRGVVELQEGVVPVGVEEGPHGDLGGVPGEGEHGDVGGGDGVEAFADGGQVPGPGLGGAGAGPPAEPVPVGRQAAGRLLQQLRVRPGAQLLVLLYVDVHGHHAHDLRDDEGEGPEVERPAVRVALLGVALPGVPGVGRYVNDDANDVA